MYGIKFNPHLTLTEKPYHGEVFPFCRNGCSWECKPSFIQGERYYCNIKSLFYIVIFN